jgi:hypothetical protein
MTESMTTALLDAGCPSKTARHLAGRLRVERPPGVTTWLLMLENHGTSYPGERDEVAYAVEHLAMNVTADNTEAVDRTVRGGQGWTPYWPLPDRAPRRQ